MTHDARLFCLRDLVGDSLRRVCTLGIDTAFLGRLPYSFSLKKFETPLSFTTNLGVMYAQTPAFSLTTFLKVAHIAPKASEPR